MSVQSAAQKVRTIFSPLSQDGHQREFFTHVSDNVDWTIKGHSPMSRSYTSKQDFMDSTLKVLGDKVLTKPLRMEVVNVVGEVKGEVGQDLEGDVVVELEAVDATCRNGLKYDMRYCWVCGFEGGKIVKVRAYLDTDLLTRAMKENMGDELKYP